MQQRTAIITKEVKVPVKVINKRGELVDFDISKADLSELEEEDDE